MRRRALNALMVVAVVAVSVPVAVTQPATAAPAGLPAFYTVPDPLAPGNPGDVIKTEPVAVSGLHGTLLRVMYHSRSIQGQDIAVTGLIAVPSSAAPPGGRPVVTWAHGTTGIADQCAPSLSPDDYSSIANQLLDAGYVVTGTDYEGLGTPGRHPYIVGESEARGTLDIVRAARQIPETGAGDTYAVWGHSQGGHAALFALHIASTWAPELHLVGVVAGAPPSQLGLVYQFLKTSPFRAYLLLAAAGLNAAYGDQAAPLDQVLTPEGIQTLPVVDDGCTADITAATAAIPTDDLVKADPNTVPAWATLLQDNDPGQFTSAGPVPLLMIQGGNDEQIPVASTQILFTQLCTVGQVEQRWVYPGQSHAGVIAPSFGDMLTWLDARFTGSTPANAVVPTGQPDVQVEECPTTAVVATTTAAPASPATPVEATPALTG